jgi:hypothetical protein
MPGAGESTTTTSRKRKSSERISAFTSNRRSSEPASPKALQEIQMKRMMMSEFDDKGDVVLSLQEFKIQGMNLFDQGDYECAANSFSHATVLLQSTCLEEHDDGLLLLLVCLKVKVICFWKLKRYAGTVFILEAKCPQNSLLADLICMPSLGRHPDWDSTLICTPPNSSSQF